MTTKIQDLPQLADLTDLDLPYGLAKSHQRLRGAPNEYDKDQEADARTQKKSTRASRQRRSRSLAAPA